MPKNAFKNNPLTQEYEERAKNLLKAELKRRGVGYRELAEKLTVMGLSETERNLANKISRGRVHSGVFYRMSCRDWLHNVALGGCLTVSILFAPLLTNQQIHAPGYGTASYAAEKKDSPQSPATHFKPGVRIDPQTYRAICDSPKDKDHADLCQQWRVAEAADSQFWLNLLGLILLGGTLVFTAIAARAARDAVREAARGTHAAQQAVEVTRRGYITEQRPWVTVRAVKPGEGHVSDDNIFVTLWIRYANVGKTPAMHVMQHSQSYRRNTDSREMVDHFVKSVTVFSKTKIGATLLPSEWVEWGHQAMMHGKSIRLSEAEVYKDFYLLKIVVGCTYQSVLSDEVYHSARSYSVYVKQKEVGKVTADKVEFSENAGGSFFS